MENVLSGFLCEQNLCLRGSNVCQTTIIIWKLWEANNHNLEFQTEHKWMVTLE